MLSEHCARCDEYTDFPLTNGLCRKCAGKRFIIDIYAFNIFNEGVKVEDTLSLTGVDMDIAKRKAHQRAVELGLKAESAWYESCKTYSNRKYRTIAGARRLVVVERSNP